MTRQLLRLATAGSVDDGKSTLIGRLLHDTDSLPLDHLESVTDTEGVADLAALSDGLRAEREQGITIDVAYRYFATDKRTFILAWLFFWRENITHDKGRCKRSMFFMNK